MKTLSEQLPDVTEKIEQIVKAALPHIHFTNIWVKPGTSWYGDEVVDIWAIYDGVVDDLHRTPDKLSIGTRIQDMLWDRGLDVLPKTHFVMKAEAGDWRPEGL